MYDSARLAHSLVKQCQHAPLWLKGHRTIQFDSGPVPLGTPRFADRYSRMPRSNDPIYDEASALWSEVFGEPAPAITDGTELLDVLIQRLPIEPFSRLRAADVARGLVFPVTR